MVDFARPILGDAEKQAVLETLDSGRLAAGMGVQRFEEEFAAYVGAQYGVATNNGTVAVHVALTAAGIGPGDQVLTTPFSFIASTNAILHCGARPVFADIDPATFNLSPTAVRQLLEQGNHDVKAMLVVHLFGLPAAIEELAAIAREYGLALIEDCAQAHGAAYKERRVGTFGDAAAFSFYATKNMTTGEGGMVLTNSPDIAERAASLINHGRVDRYEHDILGYNYRLTDVLAAIGRVQLQRVEAFNDQRRANAAFLAESLGDVSWLILPATPADYTHVYHQYTVRSMERDKLTAWLTENRIGCAVIYPIPIHKQPLYVGLGYGELGLPAAEQACTEVVSLPIHPSLGLDDLEEIVRVVRAFPDTSAGIRHRL